MSDLQAIVVKIAAECSRQVTERVDAILAATPGLDVSAAEAINRLHARIADVAQLVEAVEQILDRHLIPLAKQEGQDLLRMDLNDLDEALEPFRESLHD